QRQLAGPSFLEQLPRFGPRFLDGGPIAGDLFELLFIRGQWRARKDDAGDSMHDGDLGQRRSAAPTVDRQGQGAADSNIVERFSLVVWRYRAADVPIAFLDDDLVAERADQLVACRGRHAAELDRGAVAA